LIDKAGYCWVVFVTIEKITNTITRPLIIKTP